MSGSDLAALAATWDSAVAQYLSLHERLPSQGYDSSAAALAQATKELRALAARLPGEESDADGERYRWLRMHADRVEAARGLVDWEWAQGSYDVPDYSLDRAIDAAMSTHTASLAAGIAGDPPA